MRKTKEITIEAEGRDKGKVFVITEMSSYDGEAWAMDCFFAIMNAGTDIPDHIIYGGLAGLFSLSFGDFLKFIKECLTKVPYDRAKPIFDRLMQCVQYKPGTLRAVNDATDDIEEVKTRLLLKKEAFSLHFDFFSAAAGLISDSDKEETPSS